MNRGSVRSEVSGLPIRSLDLETENLVDFEQMQPERRRSIVQLQAGHLRFRLQEYGWGNTSLQYERWSRGVRIVLDRPSSYVAYAVITRGSGRWEGIPIRPGSILRVAGAWEVVSEGALEYVAFGVNRALLEHIDERLREPGRNDPTAGSRVGQRRDAALIAMKLLGDLGVLRSQSPGPGVHEMIAEELIRLALRLDGAADLIPVEKLSSSSSRLAVIHRVEEYLEAHHDAAPSILILCEISGVCERTLEYAFREHLEVTPARYLKLRRLTQVRRQLQNPVAKTTSVTETAMQFGFYELGRFAGDYRQLFGELPSQTLERSFHRSDRRPSSPAAGR